MVVGDHEAHPPGAPERNVDVLVPQSTVMTQPTPRDASSVSAAAWSPYPSVMRLGMYGMTVHPRRGGSG